MIKTKDIKVISDIDWDNLVIETYGKPYCFQQQEGCQDRGMVNIIIPSPYNNEDKMHNSIPEYINSKEMGVKFSVWLERDPKQLVGSSENKDHIDLFWERNFYPDLHTIANDLHSKGLIEAGEYGIEIDW